MGFDLELGQKLERAAPGDDGDLSPADAKNVGFHAFPDSHGSFHGDTEFVFRIPVDGRPHYGFVLFRQVWGFFEGDAVSKTSQNRGQEY